MTEMGARGWGAGGVRVDDGPEWRRAKMERADRRGDSLAKRSQNSSLSRGTQSISLCMLWQVVDLIYLLAAPAGVQYLPTCTFPGRGRVPSRLQNAVQFNARRRLG
jgi:hypothetical protein